MIFEKLSSLGMFLTDTGATDGGTSGGNDITSLLFTFVPLLLIVVAFYFFMIRPESKRKKEANKMRKELIVGDEITTIGGIVGKVVAIKDDTITLETGSEKARIKIMRWAISSKGSQISD